jgi:hypothetical protein
VIDWFQNTLESRKNSPDTPIIVIMQRLHEDDLAGWLLGDRGKDGNGPPVAGGNGEVWEQLRLSAWVGDDERSGLRNTAPTSCGVWRRPTLCVRRPVPATAGAVRRRDQA